MVSIRRRARTFCLPNNTATIVAAPDHSSTQGGGLLSLMRVLGCMIGIAAASSAFSGNWNGLRATLPERWLPRLRKC
jgi:hypothetical protein